MDMDAIIDALGGATQVQTLLGVGPSAVSNYRARGQFPEYARVRIWQALKARGVTVDPETLAFADKISTGDAKTGQHSPHPKIIPKSPQILLIISGGIAAYKSLELIRRIKDKGWQVRCIMTASAEQFITPLSVSALSGQTTYTQLFSLTDEAEMGHIRLAREADAIVVAPATANIMAKAAYGLADDLASTVLLASDAPLLMAPAMNPFMWAHPATQANQRQLHMRGVRFIGPDSGDTACGEDGAGRLADIPMIIDAIDRILPGQGALNGMTALVTSGPTHEPIDPVRYIANRSSGAQGTALAEALRDLGARVSFVTGPATVAPPMGVEVIKVETAREMAEAVEAALPADAAVFAAAVADWRVENATDKKMKKDASGKAPALAFSENPDILAAVAQRASNRPDLVVGFAAETNDVVENATAKRLRKGCDWIIANDVSPETGIMGGAENKVTLVSDEGAEEWPRLSKAETARRLALRISEAI